MTCACSTPAPAATAAAPACPQGYKMLGKAGDFACKGGKGAMAPAKPLACAGGLEYFANDEAGQIGCRRVRAKKKQRGAGRPRAIGLRLQGAWWNVGFRRCYNLVLNSSWLAWEWPPFSATMFRLIGTPLKVMELESSNSPKCCTRR